MPLRFTATAEERRKMREIVKRCGVSDDSYHGITMSLEACHCSDVKLDLDAMLTGDLPQVAHDVFGINRHISVHTGKLGKGFMPRYADKVANAN